MFNALGTPAGLLALLLNISSLALMLLAFFRPRPELEWAMLLLPWIMIAIAAIFLLLTANFQSFRMALAIVLTMPAVVAGALLALAESGSENLPAPLVEERSILNARALAKSGDVRGATTVLAGLDSDAALAAAVGDEPGLIAELRLAFTESAERALAAMDAATTRDQWRDAASRLKGLAASFGAVRLMALAAQAADGARDTAILGKLRRSVMRL